MVGRFQDALTNVELRESFREKPSLFEKISWKDLSEQLESRPTEEADLCRPYVGDELFGMCELYKALCIRIYANSVNMKHGLTSKAWHEDHANKSIISTLLSATERPEFDNLEFGKLAFLQRVVETRIAMKMAKLASGQDLGEQMIEHGKSLMKLLVSLPPAEGTSP